MANILLKSLLKEGADTPYDWKHDKNARWRTNDKNPYVSSDRQRQNSAKNAKNVDKIIDIADRLEKDGYECEPWGMESDGRMGLDFTKYLPGGGQIWFALAPDEDGKLKMPLTSYGETVEKAGGIRGWFGGKDNVGQFKSVDGIKIDADNLSAEDLQKTVEDTLRKGIANMQSQWSKEKNLKFPIINSLHKEAESSLKRTSSLPKSKSDTNKPNDGKGGETSNTATKQNNDDVDISDYKTDGEGTVLYKGKKVADYVYSPNTDVFVVKTPNGREYFDTQEDMFKHFQKKKEEPKAGEKPKAEPKQQSQQTPTKQAGNVDLDQKIKNPETDNDISLKSALGYNKDSAVYKAAVQKIQKDKGSNGGKQKPQEPVKGASMFDKDYNKKR